MTCDYSAINLEFGDLVLWKKFEEDNPSKYSVFAVFGDVEDNWADLYTMAYNQTATVLTVKLQSMSQAGLYQCEVQRGREVISAQQFKLTIKEPPLIECLGTTAVPRGVSTVLTCLVKSSVRPAKVTWLRNDKVIGYLNPHRRGDKAAGSTSIAQIQDAGDHLRATLEIPKVTEASYGTYTVNVTTAGGSTSANVALTEAEQLEAAAMSYSCSRAGDRSAGQQNCDSVQQKRLLARRLYERHCRHAGTGSMFYCWRLALQLQSLGMRAAAKESSGLRG